MLTVVVTAKGLEIYNPDGTTVNLADYEIQQFNNGGTAKTALSVYKDTCK
jgi:hypothetical protein